MVDLFVFLNAYVFSNDVHKYFQMAAIPFFHMYDHLNIPCLAYTNFANVYEVLSYIHKHINFTAMFVLSHL